MTDFDYYKFSERGQQIVSGNAGREKKADRGQILRTLVCWLIVAAYYALLFAGKRFLNPAGEFYRSLNLFSGAGDPNKAVRILSYVLFFMGINMASRLILNGLLTLGSSSRKMGKAVLALTASLIRYGCVIAVALFSLNTLGVDAFSIVAGLGVLSLIIGNGAKELISDVLAGLFIILEQSFGVGDIIVVNNFRGTVKVLGIRSTQIEDDGGNILVVNNSKLGNVINMTEEMSVANVEIAISGAESLRKVEGLIQENLPLFAKEIPELKEGPYYVGVSSIHPTMGTVYLSFVAKCEEGAKYRVERALTRRLRLMLEDNQILFLRR